MDDRKINLTEIFIFLFGIILGIFFLYLISNSSKAKVNFDDLALGDNTKSIFGKVDNLHVHCKDERDINLCINSYLNSGSNSNVTLWVGNSQLHAINQYTKDQNTAPIILHKLADKYNQYLISLSQPNANLQEHFLIIAHLIKKLPIKNLILPVVFDDMREDGIRSTLNNLLEDKTTKNLILKYEFGKNLLAENKNYKIDYKKDKSLSIKSERYLNTKLNSIWSLWAERPNFRGNIFNFLYRLRNFIFQINPSSTRKILPGQYKKNFEALNSIIDIAKDNEIQLIIYNVPIRNDIKIPYDIESYNQFKKSLETLSKKNSLQFLNLERIVPNNYWGNKDSTTVSKKKEVDFMHFKQEGHKILAEKLYSEMILYWAKN